MRFDNLEDAVPIAAERFRAARQVFICGNGGSAANANHIENDFIAAGIAARSLCANVATLTAIANDYCYEEVFAQQLRVLLREGDILLSLSGSGNSDNILVANNNVRVANTQTWALIGAFGTPILGSFNVPVDNLIRVGANMQEAEEAQLRFGHLIMKYLTEKGTR